MNEELAVVGRRVESRRVDEDRKLGSIVDPNAGFLPGQSHAVADLLASASSGFVDENRRRWRRSRRVVRMRMVEMVMMLMMMVLLLLLLEAGLAVLRGRTLVRGRRGRGGIVLRRRR